jgi:hypothetical protein
MELSVYAKGPDDRICVGHATIGYPRRLPLAYTQSMPLHARGVHIRVMLCVVVLDSQEFEYIHNIRHRSVFEVLRKSRLSPVFVTYPLA